VRTGEYKNGRLAEKNSGSVINFCFGAILFMLLLMIASDYVLHWAALIDWFGSKKKD